LRPLLKGWGGGFSYKDFEYFFLVEGDIHHAIAIKIGTGDG
jgi:hypothetical protein